MNIFYSPSGIVDYRHPIQGLRDMADAGLKQIFLDIGMYLSFSGRAFMEASEENTRKPLKPNLLTGSLLYALRKPYCSKYSLYWNSAGSIVCLQITCGSPGFHGTLNAQNLILYWNRLRNLPSICAAGSDAAI